MAIIEKSKGCDALTLASVDWDLMATIIILTVQRWIS